MLLNDFFYFSIVDKPKNFFKVIKMNLEERLKDLNKNRSLSNIKIKSKTVLELEAEIYERHMKEREEALSRSNENRNWTRESQQEERINVMCDYIAYQDILESNFKRSINLYLYNLQRYIINQNELERRELENINEFDLNEEQTEILNYNF